MFYDYKILFYIILIWSYWVFELELYKKSVMKEYLFLELSFDVICNVKVDIIIWYRW